jgi:hypothetical protein
VGRLVADIEQQRQIWIGSATVKESIPESKSAIGIEKLIQLDWVVEESSSEAILGHLKFHTLTIDHLDGGEMGIVERLVRHEPQGPATVLGQRSMCTWQILDGTPEVGSQLPFDLRPIAVLPHLSLRPLPLAKQFALHYGLQLTLIDRQGRHYYKQLPLSAHH